MVNLAKNWTQVPRQRKCKIEGSERYMQGFILHSFWLCLHGRQMKYSKAIGLTGGGIGPSVTVKYFHVIHSGHIHICANGFKQPSAVFAERIIFLKS